MVYLKIEIHQKKRYNFLSLVKLFKYYYLYDTIMIND